MTRMHASSAQPVTPPPGPPTHAWRLARWFTRGAWALIDQALFSLAGFLVLVLLARWLAPTDFGRFTVAHTVFLLMSTAYSALVIEAMLVRAPQRFAGQLPAYFGALLVQQAPVGLLLGAATAAIGLACLAHGASETGGVLLAMAAATPFVLLLWLSRRPWYVLMRPQRAAVGGAIYLMSVVAGLVLLDRAGRLDAPTAALANGVAALAATLFLLVGLPVCWPGRRDNGVMHRVTAEHWDYGRWAIASGFLGLLPTQVCYLVLPEVSGVESSAALRAVSNLIVPLIQVNIALSAILLPAVARHRGTPHARRLVTAGAAALVAAPLAAWLVLGGFADLLLRLCYGDRYAAYAWLVWIIGVTPALLGLATLLNIVLQSRGRQDAVFYASLAAALFSLTLGVVLIWHDGLRGAAIGVNASLVAGIVVAIACLRLPAREPVSTEGPAD
jgi:O-antigen/teichoic acid export membrane protein